MERTTDHLLESRQGENPMSFFEGFYFHLSPSSAMDRLHSQSGKEGRHG